LAPACFDCSCALTAPCLPLRELCGACFCSTLITPEGRLLTALGKTPLGAACALGPLGNLLLHGRPVPAAAAFNDRGQLIGADGVSVLHSVA
jgi:hypothetical protein